MAGVLGRIQWLMSQKAPPVALEFKGHDAHGMECSVTEFWSFSGDGLILLGKVTPQPSVPAGLVKSEA